MQPKKIQAIFKRFKKSNPKPKTELHYKNPFQLLVAVILSAQATDRSVNKATRALFPLADTPEKLLQLGETKFINYIKSVGFYRTKAKNVLKTCQILIDQYQSQVPQNREALESLPGVGRKTANVILNTCFGQPVIAVDTHVLRVSNRIGLVQATTPKEVETQLMQQVPKSYLHNAHHWLILHGRYVCVARRPKCPICLINDLCEYQHKTTSINGK